MRGGKAFLAWEHNLLRLGIVGRRSLPLKTRLGILAVVTLLFLLGTQLISAQSEGLSKIMRQKLIHAQSILDGVATEDYDMIADNVEPLLALTRRPEWNVIDRPEYASFTMEFRRAVEKLSKSAIERSPDGVAYNYQEMTMACVSCHRFVRAVRKS